MMNWSGAGIRGRLSKFYADPHDAAAAHVRSINTNTLPSGSAVGSRLSSSPLYPPFHSWGTPPRITALQRGIYRRNDESTDNYEY